MMKKVILKKVCIGLPACKRGKKAAEEEARPRPGEGADLQPDEGVDLQPDEGADLQPDEGAYGQHSKTGSQVCIVLRCSA